jgi:pimeloyl-ACP methyl ester carboxylesterase
MIMTPLSELKFLFSDTVSAALLHSGMLIDSSSVDGLILMAPYLRAGSIKKRSDVEPNSLYFLYLLLRRQLTPTKIIGFLDVVPKLKKVGGEEIDLLLKNKETNFRYTIRFIVDVIGLRNNKLNVISDINQPILIIHGKKDRLVYPEVSQTLFRIMSGQHKRMTLLDCDHWFYHTVFYQDLVGLMSRQYPESNRDKVVQVIVSWMKGFVM